MSILNTIIYLVGLFLFITLFILCLRRSIQYRNIFKNKPLEAMTVTDPLYKKIMSEIHKISLPNIDGPYQSVIQTAMPLKQYCIKASANSAYSGGFISDEMIKYVLSRGCRFLDFEVFYLPKNEKDTKFVPFVGYSNDGASPHSQSNNNVELSVLLKTALINAFLTKTSEQYKTTNIDDPLFLHFRLRGSKKEELYDSIQTILESFQVNETFKSYFITSPITANTPISKIMKKCVFIFDFEPTTKGYYHQMSSNTNQLEKVNYSQINTREYTKTPPSTMSTTEVEVYRYKYTVPNYNRFFQKNVNIFSAIRNYGIQINLMQYYINDVELQKGEELFNELQSGVVPMSYCISFIDSVADESELL